MYHKWQSYDVWFLRYRVQRTEFFVSLDCFLHFYPPNNPENQNFEKMKNHLEISSFYTYVYHKWQSHDVWFLRYGVQQTEFVFILDCFLLFYSPNNPKNQNFEKWKKRLEIPLFYTCVPQMTIIWCKVPEIWSVTYRIFSHFGLYFALLFPNNLENQNFLKWKKHLEISISDMCTKNYDHMMYASWDMVRDRWTVWQTDRKSDILRWVPHLRIKIKFKACVCYFLSFFYFFTKW